MQKRLFRILTTIIIPERTAGKTSRGFQKKEGDFIEVIGKQPIIKDNDNKDVNANISIPFLEKNTQFFEEINLREK